MYGRVREHTTDNLSNGYHYKHNVIAAVPAGEKQFGFRPICALFLQVPLGAKALVELNLN